MHRRNHSTTSTLRQKRGPKRGFRFNIMVVGTGGSGKSTFINTLAGKELVALADRVDANAAAASREKPTRLKTYTEEIADPDLGNITLRLLETVGFGDNIDSTAGLKEMLTFIQTQYDEVLSEETRIRRNPRFTDNRVHALVYLVEPTGHGLRELDIEFLRLLGPRVNIIPVIAKADSLTREETEYNKKLIREDIERYSLPVYQLSSEESEADGESAGFGEDGADGLKDAVPFALVGSNTSIKTTDGRSVLARQYPWGSVFVDDTRVSDFALLRDVLLYSHINDLRESTEFYLYENYRTQRLSEQGTRQYSAGESAGDTSGSFSPSVNDSGYADTETTVSGSQMPYLAREEQLRLEEEKLHRSGQTVQQELEQKRLELQRREQELRELEARLRQQEAARQ